MADKVTEFVNRSDLTYNDLVNGLTVVTNASSETAVIKDVFVGSQPITLTVSNGTQSNNILVSPAYGTYSGTELIGSGSTVKAYGPRGIVNNIYSIVSNTFWRMELASTYYDGTVPNSWTATNISQTTPFTFQTISPPGYSFIDSQGRWWLNTNAGQVNNTQWQYVAPTGIAETWGSLKTTTALPSTQRYIWSYDSNRYLFGISISSSTSGVIYWYDTNATTLTTATGSVAIPTTGSGVNYDGNPSIDSMAAIVRGNMVYIFTRFNANPNTQYALIRFDITNAAATISVQYCTYYSGIAATQLANVQITQVGNIGYLLAPDWNLDFSSRRGLIYWKYNFTSNTFITSTDVPVTINNATGTSSGWAPANHRISWVGSDNIGASTDETDIAFWANVISPASDTTVIAFNSNTESVTTLSSSFIPMFRDNATAVDTTSSFIPYLSSTKAINDFGTTSLRITGIKST